MVYLNPESNERFLAKKAKERNELYRAGFLKAFDDAFNSEVNWLGVTDDTDEDDLPKNIGQLHHDAEMALAFMQGHLRAFQILIDNYPNGDAASNPDWVKAVKARAIGRIAK